MLSSFSKTELADQKAAFVRQQLASRPTDSTSCWPLWPGPMPANQVNPLFSSHHATCADDWLVFVLHILLRACPV